MGVKPKTDKAADFRNSVQWLLGAVEDFVYRRHDDHSSAGQQLLFWMERVRNELKELD